MSLGAAAGGAVEGLQEILKARALKQFQDQQLQQQAFENQQSTARLGIDQQRADNEGLARQQAIQEKLAAGRDKAAAMTVGSLEPGKVVDGPDLQSILGTDQQGRLQPNRTLPSRNLVTGINDTGDGVIQSVSLRPTTAERNTAASGAERIREFNLGQLRSDQNAARSDANTERIQANSDRQFAATQANSDRTNARLQENAGGPPQMFRDDQGNNHALAYRNGQFVEIPLPDGISGRASTGGGGKLSATQQDNMAGINTAEVEGVKVLRALKSAGLDQSNDPSDPRWNQFMVQTLKVAPADFNKADIQQRTAFIQAVLTRGLLGGRPSQYVSEMVKQHMPDGAMSGMQLSHVLRNVLGQSSERRRETASLSGVPYEKLKPASGDDYESFLKSESTGGGSGIKSITEIK